MVLQNHTIKIHTFKTIVGVSSHQLSTFSIAETILCRKEEITQ